MAYDLEQLNTLSADRCDHADGITNAAAHKMEQDIRTAARVIDEHASWRFNISEIAGATNDSATAKRLLELLGKS